MLQRPAIECAGHTDLGSTLVPCRSTQRISVWGVARRGGWGEAQATSLRKANVHCMLLPSLQQIIQSAAHWHWHWGNA